MPANTALTHTLESEGIDAPDVPAPTDRTANSRAAFLEGVRAIPGILDVSMRDGQVRVRVASLFSEAAERAYALEGEVADRFPDEPLDVQLIPTSD